MLVLVLARMSCVTPRIFVYLLNLCKFFVRQSQNDFPFRNVRPGPVDVIAKVKSRLRRRLPIFFKRFKFLRRRRYFHRQWGARGVVTTVIDGHLPISKRSSSSRFYCSCFVFSSRAASWLARGYYLCFVFCFMCRPLAG